MGPTRHLRPQGGGGGADLQTASGHRIAGALFEEPTLPRCSMRSLTPKVRSFLDRVGPLRDLEAGHRGPPRDPAYGYHRKVYSQPVAANQLVHRVQRLAPASLWTGDSLYQLTWDRRAGRQYGPDDAHPPLAEGMVFVLHLKVLPGVQMPVGFEVVELTPHAVAFGYVRGNRSQGLQRLTVSADGDASAVLHESWFTSGNALRDWLYPTFHERLTDGFHLRLRELLEAGSVREAHGQRRP